MTLRTCFVVTMTALSAAFLTGCFESNTIECSGGVVCPPGSVCTEDGLGCTANGCGNGEQEGVEECDDGNQNDEDDCTRECKTNVCGDGKVDMLGPDTEECDDLGADTADCDSDCTLVVCGDNHENEDAGEICDDGGTADGDGCKGDCKSDETCGNGFRDTQLPNTRGNMPSLCLDSETQGTNCAEACDDGNTVSGDGCSRNCLSEETCQNGIRDPLGDPTASPPTSPRSVTTATASTPTPAATTARVAPAAATASSIR
jgi:cysteine-rich repeat protein